VASWPVGKKPVIKLLGLSGGGVDDNARLLEGGVDSEKVGGERDVVGGRHCARLGGCLFGGGGVVGWKGRSLC
jgi:hypothetical protein